MGESSANIRPWEVGCYHHLAALAINARVPHALLVRASERSGALRFAQAAMALLVCSNPSASGRCGDCRSCELFASGNHPDGIHVAPDEPERPVIKIDQIRGLSDNLSLASHAGGRRVALIDPGDCLNLPAANGLLKTLEEPPAGVTVILTATEPGRLPATVRSRCQALSLPVPPRHQAREWLAEQQRSDAEPLLELTDGSVERALALADDELPKAVGGFAADLTALAQGKASAPSVAVKWQGQGVSRLVFIGEHILADALRRKAAGEAAIRVPGADELIRLVTPLDWGVLYDCADELASLRRSLEQPLNEAMALERLFLAWSRALASSVRATN